MIGDRISERLAATQMSQSELARRVGVAQQTIHKLISGASAGSKYIARIAQVLGTTAAYLEGETDDPLQGALPVPTPELIADQLDLVGIASVDQDYGMGLTFADNPVEVEVMHFPRAWIEALTPTPAALLTWARGRGDSMSPTINDNDLVLIDRSERRVEHQDVIWAFTIGDTAMIKRLRVRGEKVTILSDASHVPPDEAHPDEINIVGRVAYILKRT